MLLGDLAAFRLIAAASQAAAGIIRSVLHHGSGRWHPARLSAMTLLGVVAWVPSISRTTANWAGMSR